MDSTPPPLFHLGELVLQERAGMREQVAQFAPRMIRSWMPDQHRVFFESLPYLVVGGLGANAMPVASVLTGPPGFISSPDPDTLVIEALPSAVDPLRAALQVGAPVGLLGIELSTRRRNRANGTIVAVSLHSFTVQVSQSFGNCPQYIQARDPVEWLAPELAQATLEGPQLSERAIATIQSADTFFIASASRTEEPNTPVGVDVSHRGGLPGFIQVSSDGGSSVLSVPDYSGNNLFMTLGNLSQHPKAGLTFINFSEGTLLSLAAKSEIEWSKTPATPGRPAAERVVRFRIEGGQWTSHALQYRWSAPQFAREFSR